MGHLLHERHCIRALRSLQVAIVFNAQYIQHVSNVTLLNYHPLEI